MTKILKYCLMLSIPLGILSLTTGCSTTPEKVYTKPSIISVQDNKTVSSVTIKTFEVATNKDPKDFNFDVINQTNIDIEKDLNLGVEVKEALSKQGSIISERTDIFNDVQFNKTVSFAENKERTFIGSQIFEDGVKKSETASTLLYGLTNSVKLHSVTQNSIEATLEMTDKELISLEVTETGLGLPMVSENNYKGQININQVRYYVVSMIARPYFNPLLNDKSATHLYFKLIKITP